MDNFMMANVNDYGWQLNKYVIKYECYLPRIESLNLIEKTDY